MSLATGEYTAATAFLSEALTLCRELGNRNGQGNILNFLGEVQLATGDQSAAMASQTEALAIFRDVGNRNGLANALLGIGHTRLHAGELSAATASLTESLSLYRDIGSRLGQANALSHLGRAQQLTGDRATARASLSEALSIAHDLGAPHAEILNSLGALLLDSCEDDDALTHHQQALRIARDIGIPREEARAQEGIGRCLLRALDREGGIAHLRHAFAIYLRLGAPETDRVQALLTNLEDSTATYC